MRRLFISVGVILASTSGFAAVGKSTPSLQSSLGSAWHAQQNIHLKQDKNDITMVYGGEDVSHKATLDVVAAA